MERYSDIPHDTVSCAFQICQDFLFLSCVDGHKAATLMGKRDLCLDAGTAMLRASTPCPLRSALL
jgi:hypothetical protein